MLDHFFQAKPPKWCQHRNSSNRENAKLIQLHASLYSMHIWRSLINRLTKYRQIWVVIVMRNSKFVQEYINSWSSPIGITLFMLRWMRVSFALKQRLNEHFTPKWLHQKQTGWNARAVSDSSNGGKRDKI